MNFEINFRCLVESISYITEKLGQKKYKYLNSKKSFWNKKYFGSFLKDSHLSEMVSDPRVCL